MAQDPGARDADPTFAALMRLTSVGIARGVGPRLVGGNGELGRIVGRSAEQVGDGFPWRDLAPPEQPDRLVAAVQTIVARGAVSVTTDVVRPDGTRVPVLVVGVTLPGDGPPWLALVVDLSDEQWRGRLADHESAIVSTLLDDAPVGFALMDRALRFVRINRELAAMNGTSPAEHVGRYVFDVVPDVRGSAEAALRAVLETGEPLRDVEVVGSTPADPGVEHVWIESFFPVRSHPSAEVRGIAAIARDVTRVRALQAELARVTEHQRTALEQLQRALLPDSLPDLAGWSVDARYLSASDQVRLGGDWYDVIVAEDRVVLVVGDVVGHGLTAVGMMAQARAATRAFVSEGYGPGEVLSRVARLLLTPGVSGMATAVVAALDPASGDVEYASAGHPYAFVGGAAGARRLDGAQGPMLGSSPHPYATARTTVPPGGALTMITDGLVERRGESLEVGFGRLAGLLRTADLTGGAPALVDALIRGFPGTGHRDDTCVLAVVRDAGPA
ncbi:SpoIIE family protein phosphatase [Actinotalea fermentans]|uniref:PAS domain-containing protein n=1 Tax=Actinotalea fermentans TaxID=43671 RepID=A0A511YTW8_9CELL|nr:SpoIIE family protein phosphatase [Actinotalea fermentans]KGM15805.1 hypothetical protein N867_05435 [Actinotalea fermentans ATCC 43279 = JCM 9966 = DSM 3133]GEN78637.1 hypothetical protein AFE02nite_03710 [Actinotalea fermentans]